MLHLKIIGLIIAGAFAAVAFCSVRPAGSLPSGIAVATPVPNSGNARHQDSTNKDMDQSKLHPVDPGKWGGTGMMMNVEEKAVKFEYDCAEGEIPVPLKIDEKGHFKVTGSYTRHSFGPIRTDNPPKAEEVVYEGRIDGKLMSYKITRQENDEVVGEFTAELGKAVRLHRCY